MIYSGIKVLGGHVKRFHCSPRRTFFQIGVLSMSEFFSPVPPEGPIKRTYDTIMSGTPEALNELLETKTVDVNMRFEKLRNCTPLMLASEFNKTAMMVVLINQGADLNLQDDFAREKCKDASDLLVEAGAQVDIVNYEKMTAADSTLDVELDEKLRTEVTTDQHVGPIIGGDIKK